MLAGEGAIEEEARDQRVRGGDAGDLGGGEHAQAEADDDDHRHQQRPEGTLEREPQGRPEKPPEVG